MGLYFNENSWISAGLQWPYSPEILRAGPVYDNGPIQVFFSENKCFNLADTPSTNPVLRYSNFRAVFMLTQ